MTLEKHYDLVGKIEKVFDAKSNNEASQIYYDYFGFGKYNPFTSDIFYDDDGNVIAQVVE